MGFGRHHWEEDHTYERPLVAVDITNADGSAGYALIDPDTGEEVERLADPRFDWKQKKREAIKIAKIARSHADQSLTLEKVADKLLSCSTWLQYRRSSAKQAQELNAVNFCDSRLCPICGARRARKIAQRLAKVLLKAQELDGGQFIFCTFTIPNVEAPELRAALDLLSGAFRKLTKRRAVARAVQGWFRALEITYNSDADTYHAHIHAIGHVPDQYFDPAAGLWLDTLGDWKPMWEQSLKGPGSVYVTALKDKAGNVTRDGRAAAAAAAEAAKYSVKHADFLKPGIMPDQAAAVIECYADALHGKRLISLFGTLKEAAAALQLDELEAVDLMRDDDAAARITLEEADILRNYGWHWAMCEHVHTGDEANPDHVPAAAQVLAAAAVAGSQGRPAGPGVEIFGGAAGPGENTTPSPLTAGLLRAHNGGLGLPQMGQAP